MTMHYALSNKVFCAFVLAGYVGITGTVPAATPGSVTVETYHSEVDDTDQPYSVYLPVGHDPGGKHPCVIYLHGWSGRLSMGVSTGQKEWADTRKWVLATADGRGSVNYDHVGELDVLRVREALIADHAVDPDRVYLQGFSMGGHGTYRLCVRFPDLFAAANPGAGWTDHFQFYPQYYEQVSQPNLTSYLDPTREPLLLHSASLPQAENGLPVAWRVYYGTADGVNPPENATRMLDAWRALGHDRLEEIATTGGHSFEPLENAYPFFEGKSVNRDPEVVTYNTYRLRHNGAFWARVHAFTAREQKTRIRAQAYPSESRIAVATANVERFTLSPSTMLIPTTGETVVTVNGSEAFRGTWTGTHTFRIDRDADGFPSGWTDDAPPADPPGTIRKTKGMEGPISEATRAPFVVVYGATGTAQQTADNLLDAQLFCGQWNGMMVLRWGFENPVPPGWWVQPYPFATGSHMNPTQTIAPLSDTAAAVMDLSGKNLILFGDPSSNSFIETIRTTANGPLEMAADGSGVSLNGRDYSGPTVRWVFVYPRPDAPGRLAMVSKGFLSSLPEINWSAFDLTKDFEQWPWLLPDYVVWDTDRIPSGIVVGTSQYQYLPEAYLEAGFFTSTWQLDTQPPRVRASFTGLVDPEDPSAFSTSGEVVIEASDGIGGSGVASVEYRVDGGDWQTYSGPVPHATMGTTEFEFRATDRGGSYLYGPHASTGAIRATQTLNQTSDVGRLEVKLTATKPPPNRFRVHRLKGRLAAPGARNQPGDKLKLKLELGEDLFSAGVENRLIEVSIGNTTYGPFQTDARGRMTGTDGAQGSIKGRVRIRKRKQQMIWAMKNVDLETALGIAPTDTTQMFSTAVNLTIDGASAGTLTVPLSLTRKKAEARGRVVMPKPK